MQRALPLDRKRVPSLYDDDDEEDEGQNESEQTGPAAAKKPRGFFSLFSFIFLIFSQQFLDYFLQNKFHNFTKLTIFRRAPCPIWCRIVFKW